VLVEDLLFERECLDAGQSVGEAQAPLEGCGVERHERHATLYLHLRSGSWRRFREQDPVEVQQNKVPGVYFSTVVYGIHWQDV